MAMCYAGSTCVKSYETKMTCHFGFDHTHQAFRLTQSLESCYIEKGVYSVKWHSVAERVPETPPGRSTTAASRESLSAGRAGGTSLSTVGHPVPLASTPLMHFLLPLCLGKHIPRWCHDLFPCGCET